MDVKELTERIQGRIDDLRKEDRALSAEWYRIYQIEIDPYYVRKDGDPWAREVSAKIGPLNDRIRDLETSLRVIEETSR